MFTHLRLAPLLLLSLCFISLFAVAETGQTGTAGKPMNPDLSLDGLFSMSQFNVGTPLTFEGGHDPNGNGFQIQQVELTIGASVDPYFRADANLVLTPAGIEIEEAYATSMDFPANIQLKVGQFFTGFGRNNYVHPHAWNFANKPLVLGRMFGGDGLRNPGFQLSWLTPLPWFSEIGVSMQSSTGDTAVSFRGTASKMRSLGDSIFMARSNNFIPLTEEFSANVGASYVTAANGSGGTERTHIVGGDLYLKYRNPSGLSYVSLQIEALKRFYEIPGSSLQDSGMYAELNYRLGGSWNRWVAGLRYDLVGDKAAPVATSGTPDADVGKRRRLSPVLTFFPSEFSKVRIQYDYDLMNGASAQHMLAVQFEFIIGAHGAHKF